MEFLIVRQADIHGRPIRKHNTPWLQPNIPRRDDTINDLLKQQKVPHPLRHNHINFLRRLGILYSLTAYLQLSRHDYDLALHIIRLDDLFCVAIDASVLDCVDSFGSCFHWSE